MAATPPDRTALVIGATGAFGGHAAAALLAHGWRLKALARDPAAAARRLGAAPIEIIAGDAMVEGDVIAAAAGASVIVHAANPAAYRNWAGTVIPMLENAIAAARACGARIVLPGSVYPYAPDAGRSIAEDAPQAPSTRKGAIRAAMERALEAHAQQGGRVLILRAGDFYGPGATASSLPVSLLVRRGDAPLAFLRPGPDHVGHAFAYLPDLAETLARLLDREADLPAFARFHFAGDFVAMAELIAAVRAALGRPRLPVLPFPWPLVPVLGLFDETLRELFEMRYLWRAPIGLDGSALAAFLGQVPKTPFAAALRLSLGGAAPGEGESAWNTSVSARPA